MTPVVQEDKECVCHWYHAIPYGKMFHLRSFASSMLTVISGISRDTRGEEVLRETEKFSVASTIVSSKIGTMMLIKRVRGGKTMSSVWG